MYSLLFVSYTAQRSVIKYTTEFYMFKMNFYWKEYRIRWFYSNVYDVLVNNAVVYLGELTVSSPTNIIQWPNIR